MIITVYDYANDKKEITLPDKEIAAIYVAVLSGDETGYVKFADGDRAKFDASDCRDYSYFDGQYVVDGERIKEWINYSPSRSMHGWGTRSYDRMSRFYQEE